jgi:type II secretory pathway pseudopilin PulG
MVVCTTIITVLISILVPGLRGSRDAARDITCKSQLRQLSMVTQTYSYDYKCVPVWGTIGAVPMLGLKRQHWNCPSDKLHPQYEQDSSYAYLASLYMGPQANFAQPSTLIPIVAMRAYENNPKLPLYWDLDTWHGFRNVAYWDGGADRWRN